MEKLMSTSFNSNSLSRCQTPTSLNGTLNGSSGRLVPLPKCFGKNTHVLKEDYERDRLRWQQKLEEVETKLSDASIQNSELFQTKAELKRKIIDLEKNQRPLIEQNRRLNERVRTLNGEIKKLEEKLAFVQDDYLTLRDSNERVLRENLQLKEQRAFPEKLEELNRYRNQVLEYSKCITALRQSAIEKDRRYELLLHKFRKVKKSQPKKTAEDADDHQSCIGSEGSLDSGSLLDTITEDLDEELDLATDFLRPSIGNMEYSLKQQLDLANMTIAELQTALENVENERVTQLNLQLNRLQQDIDSLQKRERSLEQQLANEQQHNELLEFQVLELTTQCSANKNCDIADKQCYTDFTFPADDSDGFSLDRPKKRHEIPTEFLAESTKGLFDAMDSPFLRKNERIAIRNSIEIVDCLQNQLTSTETELNMSNCELNRLRRQIEEEEEERKRMQDELSKKQKKKELQAEIEQLKKENKEQGKCLNKQIKELNSELENKKWELNKKEDSTRALNTQMETMQMELDILRARVSVEESTRSELNMKLTQFEEQKQNELSNLRTELKRLCQQYEQKIQGLERENLRIIVQQKEIEQLKQVIQNLENEQQNGLTTVPIGMLNIGASSSSRKTLQHTSSFQSHIERRYEEQRQRIFEYQRHVARLEEQAAKDRRCIEELRSTSAMLKQNEQLKAYNRELEAQFNTQMDMITALKKKLIMMNVNSNDENLRTATNSVPSTPSEIWKLRKPVITGNQPVSDSNSNNISPSVSSDEQYHSEGSESGGGGTKSTGTIKNSIDV